MKGQKTNYIREEQIYGWWEHLPLPFSLNTAANKPVLILNKGSRNLFEGPDYLNAQILLNGRIRTGAVEFHKSSADWYHHGHHKDTKYNKVILHISLFGEPDLVIRKQNKYVVPQIILHSIRPPQAKLHHPCYHTNKETYFQKIEELAEIRLQRKKRRIQARIKRYGPKKALFVSVAEALGYSRLKRLFFRSALKIDLSQSIPQDLSSIHRLILRSFPELDDRANNGRPQNCFSRRIEALSVFLYNLLQDSFSFTYDKKRYVGKARQQTIFYNVIIFFKYRSMKTIGNTLRASRIAETTHPLRVVLKQLGLPVNTKLYSELFHQGAIELFTNYCQKGRCFLCPLITRSSK